MIKFILKTLLNFGVLLLAARYFEGFFFTGGLGGLLVAACALTVLYTLLRPILKIIFIPFVWLTLGLFNVVISMFLLWLADFLLPQFTITSFLSLFLTSLLLGVINAF